MSKAKISSIGYFELNPRGNLWANDKSGLGRRLLHRMGWSEGQGLGKKEDGISCIIRPQTTQGNKGLGFTEKLPFIKESQEFDSVLEKLNKKFQTSSESKKGGEEGLEQRCQQFKKRLHYRKFVRGKDVGRYSQKDMAAIFVTRKDKTSSETPEREVSVTSTQTFQSPLNINDYFARKMQDKKIGLKEESQKKKLLPTEETSCKKKTMTSGSDTETPSKKTSLPSQDTETSDTDSEASVEVSLSTSKRKHLPSDEIESSCKKRTKASNLDPETPSKKTSLPSQDTETSDTDSDAPVEVSNLPTLKRKPRPSDETEPSCKKRTKLDPEKSSKKINLSPQNTEAPLKNIPSDPNSEIPNEVGSLPIQKNSEPSTEVGSSPTQKDSEPSAEVGGLPPQKDSEPSTEVGKQEDSEVAPCLELPSSGGRYNEWLESQRTASRMRLYRGMVRRLRAHPVLRTANLTHIKGYGNNRR